MTHDAREKSAQAGEPIELYEFVWVGGTRRYTSAQATHIVDGKTWTAAKLQHSDIEHTGELAKNDITIDCEADFEIAGLFVGPPPDSRILLTVWEYHLGEDDAERAVVWTGSILNCEWPSPATAKLTGENIYTSLRRPGLRRKYQTQCQHSLYNGVAGTGCAVNRDDFKTDHVVLAIDGLDIQSPTLDALEDGYFAGGYIQFSPVFGVSHVRAIRSHVGDTISITHPVPGLVAGVTFTAFAGCDHTPTQCKDKFDNYVNYGGFPDRNKQNPFGSSSPF